MAANNYCGFTYGGTQYQATGTGTAYPATQAGYAVAAPPTPGAYGTQRPATGYDQAYQAAATQGQFASGMQAGWRNYDATKTYYQQNGAAYTPQPPPTPTVSKTHYSAPPTRNITVPTVKPPGTANQTATQIQAQSNVATNPNTAPKPPQTTTSATTYSNYDAALYSAATMYMAQQANKTNAANTGWQQYNKKVGQHGKGRAKANPRPQQLHYCEVCKISCAGPQTYREHLEGQKHKKREASLKMAASAQQTTQNRGNSYHCELCDVTCTGTDAYAAHIRGAKHQKVVKLHQVLGKPIPPSDPKKPAKINFVPEGQGDKKEGEATGTGATAAKEAQEIPKEEDIKPVGNEYIEEIKDDEGKILSFNCKLCECKFNDPNAKEMHMKGRRHRLQYKRKVQPDLVVDVKPTPRQRRLAEQRAQRALMSSDYWNSRRGNEMDDDDYWEGRRYDDEYDYWMSRGYGRNHPMGRSGPPIGHPFYGMMAGRRPESSDDRHVVARHAEIYPKEEELQVIQRIVSHTERALKYVSDVFTESKSNITVSNTSTTENAKEAENGEENNEQQKANKEDGRDNQMFSFQKEADATNIRILKGVMRVGLLAKGLLLQGDNLVKLVVLCAEKPSTALLKKVASELPVQLKKISEEQTYKVTMSPVEGAVLVTDGTITVKVCLTSPLLREQDSNNVTSTEQKQQNTEDLLPREPCLQALAELRHAKWFQARATGLQSCVMIMRIMRDMCQRLPTWQSLDQWAMELFVEKVISSAGVPLSPGDCLRRVMEALSSGFLINGPGIIDPCEKEPRDALQGLSKQQREDLTVSSQIFLRYIAFRKIYKVLDMEPLPPSKFQSRPWRMNRKRRRSNGDANENDGIEGKQSKKDEEKMECETTSK